MSADNYYLIRRRGKRFAATCEFMSDEKPQPLSSGHVEWFDDVLKAIDWACEEYSEYGVKCTRDVSRCALAAHAKRKLKRRKR